MSTNTQEQNIEIVRSGEIFVFPRRKTDKILSLLASEPLVQNSKKNQIVIRGVTNGSN